MLICMYIHVQNVHVKTRANRPQSVENQWHLVVHVHLQCSYSKLITGSILIFHNLCFKGADG